MAKFADVFEDVTRQGTKIPTNRYLEKGVYPIIVPPMELQNQFATFVEQTDKSKLCGEMEVAA